MLRYTKILLILLIVGGCIYETGHSLQKNELERAGIDRGKRCTTGTIKPKYAVLPKENSRKGFYISNTIKSIPRSNKSTQKRVKGHEDRVRDARPSGRNSNRNSSSNPMYQIFLITAYTKHDKGMNGKGITTSKTKAKMYRTVAASRGYKMGMVLYIPYFKNWPNKGMFVVEDRGGGIQKNDIDIFIDGPNAKEIAKQIGKRKLKGVILDGNNSRGK